MVYLHVPAQEYFTCDISSNIPQRLPIAHREIRALRQIGKVLALAPHPAPPQRDYLSSLNNSVISQAELLEVMLQVLSGHVCTCDSSVWNITPCTLTSSFTVHL